MDKLINLFSDLNISNENTNLNRLIDGIQLLSIDNKPIENITNIDNEIDDLINNMDDLQIKDSKIIIKSNKGTRLIINFADCGIAYCRKNPLPIPHYIQSF